jgi:transforming growth factor-beta-induced protein
MKLSTRNATISMPRIVLTFAFLGTVAFRVVVSQAIGNFLEVLSSSPEFSQLKAFVDLAELGDILVSDVSRTTFFAPTNSAFSTVPLEVMSNFMSEEWAFHLENFLLYHIAGREILYNNLLDGTTLESLIDEPIGISIVNGKVILDGASAIVEGDIIVSNGVIHAIDNVLPPSWYARTIADVLTSDGERFSNFLELDTDGFMSGIISSPGPYTLFAPLDSGFDALDLAARTSEAPEFLRDVLGYHLVSGIYTGSDLMQASELYTLFGGQLKIQQSQDRRGLTVNGQLLVQSDLLTSNGIVHVISGVLMPIDGEEMEQCMFWKATEEMRGIDVGVQCGCVLIDSKRIELTCTEREGVVCAPKYAACSESMSCCAASQRRCFAGQCRDVSRPERVKLGSALGGAEARSSRRYPDSGRNLRSFDPPVW